MRKTRKVVLTCMAVLLMLSFIQIHVLADENERCIVPGYVKAEGDTNVKSGFKVQILGANIDALTDKDGYFEIFNVPKNDTEQTIRISKPGFLTRDIVVDYLDGSSINFASCPIEMWAGDIPKDGVSDGAINFSDVVQIAAAFNSVDTDSMYKEYCDLNMDKSINISDIVLLAKRFNATSTDYEKPVIKLPKVFPAGKVEAEAITLSGYVEDKHSGVDCIKLADTIGASFYKFGGDIGFYDINIRYLDEDNGQSKMGLYINGSCKEGHSWNLDSDDNMWKVVTMKNVLLKKGDKVSVQGNRKGQESNRIDYIETVLQSVPTATPTPVIMKISGTVVKSNVEGVGYMIGLYALNNFLPDMESLVGKSVEVTGYASDKGEVYIHPYTPFKVQSYKILSGAPNTPAPTEAPETVKLMGILAWNDLEDGFWGILGDDGKKYSLGELNLDEFSKGSRYVVEVTGYALENYVSPTQWGTPFKLISIKRI